MPQVPIIMPQLGESIAEATIVDIKVKPGDRRCGRSGNHRCRDEQSGHGRDHAVQGQDRQDRCPIEGDLPRGRGARLHRSERRRRRALHQTRAALSAAEGSRGGNSGARRSGSRSRAREKNCCSRWRRGTRCRIARSCNYEGSNFPFAAGARAHG